MSTEPLLAVAAQTDTGRVRSHNEDAIAVDAAQRFAILADGMGGYQAGEVASALAIQTIRDDLMSALRSEMRRPVPALLASAIQRANAVILEAAADPDCRGMGTTVVAAVFQDEQAVIAHVGDSRAYRLRHGSLLRLTRDHSVLQDHIDAGLVTPEEARHSPLRNLVTRAVGSAAAVEVDVHEHRMEADDLYLLCSDGLTDMLDDPDIQRILTAHAASLETACAALIREANANGGTDNISVVLIKIMAGAQEGLLRRIRHWVRAAS